MDYVLLGGQLGGAVPSPNSWSDRLEAGEPSICGSNCTRHKPGDSLGVCGRMIIAHSIRDREV